MKGLFLDNLFKSLHSIKLFAVLVLGAGIAVLVAGNDTALELFVYLSITALSINGVSNMRKDGEAKWNRLELTLPVRRRDIITMKYASYLFWVVAGCTIAAVFTSLAVLIHGNIFFVYGVRDMVSLFTLGVGIAVFVGALFYPLAYLFGTDRSETLLIISVIGGIGLSVLLIAFVNRFPALQYYTRLGVFALFFLLLYAMSYLLSIRIFSKKEFS